MSNEGEMALNLSAYAAPLAAQPGPPIIKVKLPTAHLEFKEARKVYEVQHIPHDTLTERMRQVLGGTTNRRRMVIFMGGAKTEHAAILDEVRPIRAVGGFGSSMGRNSFQHNRLAALGPLDPMIRIYKGEML